MKLTLAGTWTVRLDPDNTGVDEGWANHEFESEAILPGSLDTNGIGEPNLVQDYLGGLSRKVRYTGPAWYSRMVELPESWSGTDLILTLERVHWFSQIYVDGQLVGEAESLSVPHVFRFTPGRKFHLVIRVDNTPRIPIGRICHALTDWTQTNWNGIIGDICLAPANPTSIHPLTARSLPEGLLVEGYACPNQEVNVTAVGHSVATQADETGFFTALLERNPLPEWSCEAPETFEIEVRAGSEAEFLRAGYRRFTAGGRLFHLNDRPTFLRGTLEACVFPKTGFPPTDVESWTTLMKKVRAYGLNHVRFHSWCPPEAAFVAADAVGILLQVECPLWTGTWALSSDPALLHFTRREAFRILSTYGHHPSFVLFTLGNEMAFYGPEHEVDQLLRDLKTAYPHILFNFSSHGTHLSPECDYYVQADNGKPGADNRPLRGSTWFGVGSRFDRESPGSLTNCDEASTQFDRPVIAHEVAEWAVFPNITAESTYDGVLEARNFATIRKGLQARGMEDQADAFVQASGKLSAALYKEEIESLMRTRDLAGYQLLGLSDFPGQGTATIGMLDAFWQEKGFIVESEFSAYCASTVPLLETERFTWSTTERFCGKVLVSHFGADTEAEVAWSLAHSSGLVPTTGTMGPVTLVAGERTPPIELEIPLGELLPGKYKLTVSVENLGTNSWYLWVFAEALPEVSDAQAKVYQWFRDDARESLRAGQTVWLRMNPSRTWSGISGRYAPAFWSPIHFVDQIGTMGTLIQSSHPIFKDFPTESHTEWHWWDILTRSKAMNINALPLAFRPILQVIDRYERNHKLGTIWEAKVGQARLLVSFIDFDTPDRLAARQLEYSIRTYLASDSFAPQQSISLQEIDTLFSSEP